MARNETAAPTGAMAALLERQLSQPPSYPLNSVGKDRVQALLGLLKLPESLQGPLAQGRIAVGEIGDDFPDARTLPVGSDGFLVTLTSGIMDFYYAVGRSLAGATVTWSNGAPQNKPALPLEATAKLVADTFKQWRKFCQPKLWDIFWRKHRIEHPDFQITPGAHNITEKLVTSAELFMLAHELGHAALDLKLVELDIENEEMRADVVGMYLYLQSAQETMGLRMAMAGAAFAVRVTGGLSRTGVKFSREYPPAPDRLAGLLGAMRARCGTDQAFDEAATVLVANLDLMDHVDDLIDPGGPKNDFELWQVGVRMIAILLAVAAKNSPATAFTEVWAYETARRPVADMRKIAQKLLHYYPAVPGPDGYIDVELRGTMHRTLQDRIATMAPLDRAPFEACHDPDFEMAQPVVVTVFGKDPV